MLVIGLLHYGKNQFVCSTVRIRGRRAPIGWEQAGLRGRPRHCTAAGREGERVSHKLRVKQCCFLTRPC